MRSLPYPDPGRPDLRSPGRLLWWIARQQATSLLVGMTWGTGWFVAQALLPVTIGTAIDRGVIAHNGRSLLEWSGVVLGLAVLVSFCGIMRHRAAVANWLQAAFRMIQLLGEHTATVGSVLPQQIPTGEVVATVASDAQRVGGMYDVFARFTGAVVSYVVVAFILLRISVPLGLLVLVGVPIVTAALGGLIGPLHHRQAEQREQVGRLTTLGADTVAGLRVLRGIGGEETFARRYAAQSERVRQEGVRVAGVQSVLDAAHVFLPGVFVVLITWIGARFAIEGKISAGQLVAAYGYAAFLVAPLGTTIEMADRATRAYVGARRVIRVLSVRPAVHDPLVSALPPAPGAALVDPLSGLVVGPGQLTAIVSAYPEESAALADRLGRFGGAGEPAGNETSGGVQLGGVPLSALPLAEVRRRVVVSETEPRLFTGVLREELAGPSGARLTDEEIWTAIEVASAADAVDALPDGLDSRLEERGRSLSGGQRQRLALVRALLRDAETLVLVEPTSAVDAHTEARIGQRLRDSRSGRATVVVTSSPLLLDHADRVVFLAGGRVRASGTHEELLATTPAYRSVVLRGEEGGMKVPNLALGPGGRLPVATSEEVRGEARRLFREHRRPMTVVLVLHGLAALTGLVAPPVIGRLVQDLGRHSLTVSGANRYALVLGVAVVVQSVLTRYARYSSFVLGEKVFARLREQFIDRVLALPLSTVERAGTGDLVSRTTNDIDALSETVRFAVPSVLVACVTTVLTLGATFLAGWSVALPVLVGIPLLWVSTRWYLRRAPEGYLAERAAYAEVNGAITETVDGARTVDALGLSERRIDRTLDDLRAAYGIERYTLRLRMVWFPTVELTYLLPVSLCLLWGGYLVRSGHASVAAVTAVTLYVVQLVDPVDELLSWLDEVQVGAASLGRIIGVQTVPPDRTPSGAVPTDDRVNATAASYAYREGHDVLHSVSLALQPGERLAVVGPSGAGKSTLGRLLAGIHPPTRGTVTVGGVPLVDLPLDELRGQVALVTQEHHVFVGSLEDNLRLARPDATEAQLRSALESVDAVGWAEDLPRGLQTVVGTGGRALTPAQAQQIALARLVLADPHTLVLDEATSLLDPRAARHLERSLSAVLEGRTVVAIAHRLHTAHDADRVAVVEDGRISELGSHDELLASGGAYAALWRSWQRQPSGT